MRYTPGNPYELVSQLSFASDVPAFSKIGPQLSARPVVATVVSSLARPFVTRRCPGSLEVLDENDCGDPAKPAYQQTEPVRLRARIADISYVSEPVNTLDCSTKKRRRFAGTLEDEMIREACTPVMANYENITDELGRGVLGDLAITSGSPGEYTVRARACPRACLCTRASCRPGPFACPVAAIAGLPPPLLPRPFCSWASRRGTAWRYLAAPRFAPTSPL